VNVSLQNTQQHIGCNITAVSFIYDYGATIFEWIYTSKSKTKKILIEAKSS